MHGTAGSSPPGSASGCGASPRCSFPGSRTGRAARSCGSSSGRPGGDASDPGSCSLLDGLQMLPAASQAAARGRARRRERAAGHPQAGRIARGRAHPRESQGTRAVSSCAAVQPRRGRRRGDPGTGVHTHRLPARGAGAGAEPRAAGLPRVPPGARDGRPRFGPDRAPRGHREGRRASARGRRERPPPRRQRVGGRPGLARPPPRFPARALPDPAEVHGAVLSGGVALGGRALGGRARVCGSEARRHSRLLRLPGDPATVARGPWAAGRGVRRGSGGRRRGASRGRRRRRIRRARPRGARGCGSGGGGRAGSDSRSAAARRGCRRHRSAGGFRRRDARSQAGGRRVARVRAADAARAVSRERHSPARAVSLHPSLFRHPGLQQGSLLFAGSAVPGAQRPHVADRGPAPDHRQPDLVDRLDRSRAGPGADGLLPRRPRRSRAAVEGSLHGPLRPLPQGARGLRARRRDRARRCRRAQGGGLRSTGCATTRSAISAG